MTFSNDFQQIQAGNLDAATATAAQQQAQRNQDSANALAATYGPAALQPQYYNEIADANMRTAQAGLVGAQTKGVTLGNEATTAAMTRDSLTSVLTSGEDEYNRTGDAQGTWDHMMTQAKVTGGQTAVDKLQDYKDEFISNPKQGFTDARNVLTGYKYAQMKPGDVLGAVEKQASISQKYAETTKTAQETDIAHVKSEFGGTPLDLDNHYRAANMYRQSLDPVYQQLDELESKLPTDPGLLNTLISNVPGTKGGKYMESVKGVNDALGNIHQVGTRLEAEGAIGGRSMAAQDASSRGILTLSPQTNVADAHARIAQARKYLDAVRDDTDEQKARLSKNRASAQAYLEAKGPPQTASAPSLNQVMMPPRPANSQLPVPTNTPAAQPAQPSQGTAPPPIATPQMPAAAPAAQPAQQAPQLVPGAQGPGPRAVVAPRMPDSAASRKALMDFYLKRTMPTGR